MGALQVIGGAVEMIYGGGYGGGGGGGYLIGSGIDNLSGKKEGSFNQPGGFGADLLGSLGLGGLDRHESASGRKGAALGGLLGGLGGGGGGGGSKGGGGSILTGGSQGGGLQSLFGGGQPAGGQGGSGILGGLLGGGGGGKGGGGTSGGGLGGILGGGGGGKGGSGGGSGGLLSPQGLALTNTILQGITGGGSQGGGQPLPPPNFQQASLGGFQLEPPKIPMGPTGNVPQQMPIPQVQQELPSVAQPQGGGLEKLLALLSGVV